MPRSFHSILLFVSSFHRTNSPHSMAPRTALNSHLYTTSNLTLMRSDGSHRSWVPSEQENANDKIMVGKYEPFSLLKVRLSWFSGSSRSPLNLLANAKSWGWMVTHLAWMVSTLRKQSINEYVSVTSKSCNTYSGLWTLHHRPPVQPLFRLKLVATMKNSPPIIRLPPDCTSPPTLSSPTPFSLLACQSIPEVYPHILVLRLNASNSRGINETVRWFNCYLQVELMTRIRINTPNRCRKFDVDGRTNR